MHQKRVKVKQLKGGRHNGQFAVITYDQPETDPTVQERVENEVTVAICRHATLAKVVEDHFRKLFASLPGANVPDQASEGRGDPKGEPGDTVPVAAVLFDNLKQAVEFREKCDADLTSMRTGAMKDANNWIASSASNLVKFSS